MSSRFVLLGAAVVLALGAGCRRDEEPRATAQAATPATGLPTPAQARPVFVRAREGDAADAVRAELAALAPQKRDVLVYVGATWCEPCQRFHHAVQRGELDDVLPRLTLIEFDADADGPRLARAGYGSQFIPLFARPGADGRSTDKRIQGSIKGEGAVAEITPRLKALLAP